MTSGVATRLTKERSPYLKAAAHQPVHWYPWSPEAFEEAERLDRPILLDIGAAWCHWCHVIDRESYENEEIARLINEHFIPIKVDRDERPDIDFRYQLAVSALTGLGGWPLTAFLTPKGEVFYGGTYFPPKDSYGQPGFKRILKRLAELYANRKQAILEDAKKSASLFESSKSQIPSLEALKAELIERCLSTLKHQFDFTHGGFGNAPKFFHPSALEFILDQYFFSRAGWLKAVIEKTLEGMGKGGIYDQLGGGFHRYSVDERWVVPHFEKMSYDNASLLVVYSKALSLLKKPFFREIALGIIRWTQDVLTDAKRGGFYASQDADIDLHDDGDYYTWTQREVEQLLTPEEASVLLSHFDIEVQGEMYHDPSRNVLFVNREPESLARDLELKLEEVLRRIESAKRKLLEARKKRKTPFVDRTLYSNWNGMWIRAYLAAHRSLKDQRLKDFALKTLDRFIEKGFSLEKGMVRCLSEEDPPGEGLLEDQVEMLAAALEAFEVTSDSRYLEFSEKLARILLERYLAEDGGFFDIPFSKEEGHLRFRERRIQDTPAPSPNATAAWAFLKLYHLTEQKEYLEKVESLLRFFHQEANTLSYFAAGYARVLDFYLKGATKILLGGKREDPLFQSLREVSLFNFRPYLVILPLTKEARAQATVCVGKTCRPVTDNPEELVQQILGI